MSVFGNDEDSAILRPQIIRIGKSRYIDNGFVQTEEQALEAYNAPHPAYEEYDPYNDEPEW